MPDPLLYFQSMGVAAIASAIIALAVLWPQRSSSPTSVWRNMAGALAITGGLLGGFYVLELPLAWLPKNGLDRLLMIVAPGVLAVEFAVSAISAFGSASSIRASRSTSGSSLASSTSSRSRWIGWLLRLGFAAAVPRILLHGSVYLTVTEDWTALQAFTLLAGSGALLGAVWVPLEQLAKRGSGLSLPISLCLAAQSAGATVMMAGYINGGAAAIPIVASLAATALVAHRIFPFAGHQQTKALATRLAPPVVIGFGVVNLFSILFIGRFFGRLTTFQAMVILLAPLSCWIGEVSGLRRRQPWLVGTIQIAAVAIPLTMVLFAAAREFQREMSPLL